MSTKKSIYDNNSISSLKGADRVRKRPGVIFGSDGIEGCQHSIFEILSNSIDEAREGFGKKIELTKFKDGSIKVSDNGRGIPVDFNEIENRYNWELVFCELYAGGKYKNSDSNNYEYSLGLNGLGLCATQYASEFMDVDIYRDGFHFNLHFEKGENINGLKKEIYKGHNRGTKIHWKPDLEVFTDIDVSSDYFLDTLKRQAIVNNGITFVFKEQSDDLSFKTTEFYYENGISDHVRELSEENAFTSVQSWRSTAKVRDRDDKAEYNCKIYVSLAFCNKNSTSEFYHNSSYLEYGGAPQKAVKSAFVNQIDSLIKSLGKYNKNESKINFTDIEDSLIIVISSFSNVTSYENQTKKSITNKGIQDAITKMLKRNLETYFLENPIEARQIVDQILINKRSRENAEKTRLNLKKKLSNNLDITNRIAKFVDCRIKDPSKRELFIVEGDSALGACKQARNPDFQAIIPVRGKILNCLKADYSKIFKNDIITDLIKVLGCGISVNAKNIKNLSNFNIDNLRYNKIIICTDADVDGFQIRTLILTMLYRLVPQLISLGKVFIAESPLYEINSKGKTYFAYSEQEKLEYLSKLSTNNCSVQRSKGLGENEPEMMSLTTMDPKTRRLIKIMPTDVQKTADTFNLLLGDNLIGRKEYISQNGHLYINMTDVS